MNRCPVGGYDPGGARKVNERNLAGGYLALWENVSGRYQVCLHGNDDEDYFMDSSGLLDENSGTGQFQRICEILGV